MFDSGRRPTVIDVLLEREAVAGRQHEAAGAGATGALAEAALDLEPARAERLVDHELDVDRAHEAVALVAGVRPGGVAQLAAQRVAHLAELAVVARRQVDREVVGDDRGALHADRHVVVHLAGEAAGQLDGTDARPEGARERALHHAFQSPFEATDRHGTEGYRHVGWLNRRLARPVSCLRRRVARPSRPAAAAAARTQAAVAARAPAARRHRRRRPAPGRRRGRRGRRGPSGSSSGAWTVTMSTLSPRRAIRAPAARAWYASSPRPGIVRCFGRRQRPVHVDGHRRHPGELHDPVARRGCGTAPSRRGSAAGWARRRGGPAPSVRRRRRPRRRRRAAEGRGRSGTVGVPDRDGAPVPGGRRGSRPRRWRGPGGRRRDEGGHHGHAPGASRRPSPRARPETATPGRRTPARGRRPGPAPPADRTSPTAPPPGAGDLDLGGMPQPAGDLRPDERPLRTPTRDAQQPGADRVGATRRRRRRRRARGRRWCGRGPAVPVPRRPSAPSPGRRAPPASAPRRGRSPRRRRPRPPPPRP